MVMNNYERYVDDYTESIGIITNKYFGLEKGNYILSRAFYKIWEIYVIFGFEMIINKKSKINTAHIAEGPGSFI